MAWTSATNCYHCPDGKYQDKVAYHLCHLCAVGKWTGGFGGNAAELGGKAECTVPPPFAAEIAGFAAASRARLTLSGFATLGAFGSAPRLAAREALSFVLVVHVSRITITNVSFNAARTYGDPGSMPHRRRLLLEGSAPSVTVGFAVWCSAAEAVQVTAQLDALASSDAQQEGFVSVLSSLLLQSSNASGGGGATAAGLVSVAVDGEGPLPVINHTALDLHCEFGGAHAAVAVGYMGPCHGQEYCKRCQCTWDRGGALWEENVGQKTAVCGVVTAPLPHATCLNVHCNFNAGFGLVQVTHSHVNDQHRQTASEGGNHHCKYNSYTQQCRCVCHGEQNVLWHSYHQWCVAAMLGCNLGTRAFAAAAAARVSTRAPQY
jgi:hypothetical protein